MKFKKTSVLLVSALSLLTGCGTNGRVSKLRASSVKKRSNELKTRSANQLRLIDEGASGK